jgi:hypothetical protein
MNQIVPPQTNECKYVCDYGTIYDYIFGQMVILILIYIYIMSSNQIYQQTLKLVQNLEKEITELKNLFGYLKSSTPVVDPQADEYTDSELPF